MSICDLYASLVNHAHSTANSQPNLYQLSACVQRYIPVTHVHHTHYTMRTCIGLTPHTLLEQSNIVVRHHYPNNDAGLKTYSTFLSSPHYKYFV